MCPVGPKAVVRLLPAVCVLSFFCTQCVRATAQVHEATARGKAYEFYQRASQLYLEGRYAAAADELARSLQLDPQQPRATRLLGICYQLTDRLDEAEKAFLHASRLDAKDAKTWFFLGRVYYVQNFFAKALPVLETALRLDSRDARIHELLALTLEAQGETDRALREYGEAVRWNGMRQNRTYTPHLNYGVFLHKLNRLDESEKQLLISRDLNQEDWQTHFELGKLYHDQTKLEAAAKELVTALKTGTVGKEDRVRVYRLLGRVYYQMGREQDARNAMTLAETAKP